MLNSSVPEALPDADGKAVCNEELVLRPIAVQSGAHVIARVDVQTVDALLNAAWEYLW
jgi:hypothetical protein